MFGLTLRKKLGKKHLALLIGGILCLRFGSQYFIYGMTGDWLWKNNDETRFVMVNAGTPDSEGNRIAEMEILQDTGGGSWVSRGSYNYSDYIANNDISGIQNQTTRFSVTAWVNYTLFDSPTEAQNGLQIQISITGEFTGVEFTIDEVTLEGTTRYIVSGYYDWSYPVIASYDVNINLFIAGTVTVGNTQDLTETGETATGLFDSASSFKFDGTTDTDGQYFTAGGFRPFSGVNAVTVEVWFETSDILPSDIGHSFIFVSQYQGWVSNCHIFAGSGDDVITARIGNSTHGTQVATGIVMATYTTYHLLLTWEASLNGTLYVNNTVYSLDLALTGTIQAASDFCIGERESSAARELRGRIYEVSIFGRPLSQAEVTQEFNGGPDFIVSTTGLNNSWSFNERLHGYDIDEGTLHDGLTGLTSREAWDIDLVSQSYASFLFPWPNSEPVFWIWLIGGVCGIIATPILFVKAFKGSNNKFKLFMIFFTIMAMAWALFVGSN